MIAKFVQEPVCICLAAFHMINIQFWIVAHGVTAVRREVVGNTGGMLNAQNVKDGRRTFTSTTTIGGTARRGMMPQVVLFLILVRHVGQTGIAGCKHNLRIAHQYCKHDKISKHDS